MPPSGLPPPTASSGWACCAAPGCPEAARCTAPATASRVAPQCQSIGCTGGCTLSCLNASDSSTLPTRVASGFPWPCRPAAPPMWSCELPRLPHRSGFAGDGAIGFPIVRIHSAVLIDRFPGCPSLGPSVSPMIRCRVAPHFGSSGSGWCAFRVASGRAFRLCQWPDRRVSPVRSPLVSPSVELAGCPASSGPLASPSAQFQVALNLGVTALASGPRLRVSPDRLPFGFPSAPLRVAPLGYPRLGR
jgi:hypothetical protein